MTHRPLLAAAAVAALCAIVAVALLAGTRTGVTSALFNAQTKNTGSAFAGGWVAAATPAAPTLSGANVNLSWTPGAQGVAAQRLYWADNGTSSTCTAPTFSALGGALPAATTSATDTGRGSGSTNGHYVCYRIDSVNNSWTTPASFAAVRVGFVATSVSMTDSNATLANNDTFVVRFNQRPAVPASTKVCTFASPTNVILIGDPSNCASSNDAAALRFSLSSGSLARTSSGYAATYTVDTTTNTLTATITTSPTTANRTTATSPVWVFTPGTITSFTGGAAACTSSPSCTPTPTGSF